MFYIVDLVLNGLHVNTIYKVPVRISTPCVYSACFDNASSNFVRVKQNNIRG